MNMAIKKKLCWNCEGSVGFSEEHCPFCGVYLSPTSPPEEEVNLTESEEFVHEPPYRLDEEREKNQEHSSPYSSQDSKKNHQHSSSASSSSADELRQIATPMVMILAGSVFFLFGLVLVLFSKDGKLTLQWKSDFWYVYMTCSLLMLFWGWRTLQLIDD